jgi:hypothetical protein
MTVPGGWLAATPITLETGVPCDRVRRYMREGLVETRRVGSALVARSDEVARLFLRTPGVNARIRERVARATGLTDVPERRKHRQPNHNPVPPSKRAASWRRREKVGAMPRAVLDLREYAPGDRGFVAGVLALSSCPRTAQDAKEYVHLMLEARIALRQPVPGVKVGRPKKIATASAPNGEPGDEGEDRTDARL